MASALSDTHALIFTRIPKSIRKQWNTTPFSIKSRQRVNTPATKHEYSIINSVVVEINYSEIVARQDDMFTENDDHNDEQFKAWQVSKRYWEIIDTAITSGIKEIIESAVQSASTRSVDSIDVLVPNNTSYTNQTRPPQSTQTFTEVFERLPLTGTAQTVTSEATHIPFNDSQSVRPGDSVSFVPKKPHKRSGKSQNKQQSRLSKYLLS